MKCKQCQTDFEKSSYDEICSRKCNTTYNAKINEINSECRICGVEFTYDARKPRVVCSRKCANELQKSPELLDKKREKIKSTLLSKYGVSHNSQIPRFEDKRKATMLSKYGNPNFRNTGKIAATKKLRYGDSTYNNRDKIQETMTEKYGVKAFSQSPKFKEILRNKYGVDHPMLIPKNREAAYRKVVGRLTEVTPLFDFNEYDGVNCVSDYKFSCNVCYNVFTSRLDDGHIPICRVCNPVTTSKSKCEFEIIDWLQEIYNGEIIHGDRSVLSGKELDIFIPELNLAIEMNGLYYHGEITGGKGRNYHLTKTKRCAERGITLYHIYDIEWINKRDIIKSILSNRIDSSKIQNIHGRACRLTEIDAKTSNEFLHGNHIQGGDNSSVRIGLYHKDELVSVLTFGKNRFNKDTEWEMYRFCSKIGCNVRGGLEKMFKFFKEKYRPVSIVSFADRRYFTGESYGRIGFTPMDATPPNYHYFKINDHKTIFSSRNKFQKHRLPKLLETFDSALTEWQNMQVNGYDRIWDCGNMKWVWSVDHV